MVTLESLMVLWPLVAKDGVKEKDVKELRCERVKVAQVDKERA